MVSTFNEILQRQKNQINYFFDHIDPKDLQRITQTVNNRKGTLFFSGVGKSAIIAQKVASTFLSIGKKAFYLSATDALHGDLGMVEKDDLLVIFSKSGKTKELIHLIPYIRDKGVHTIAAVCSPNTTLSSLCDDAIYLPIEREICPFNLAPTTSTTAQLLFGDFLAIAYMEKRDYTMQEYAANHPGGMIGHSLTHTVQDLMFWQENTPLCYPHDLLIDKLCELTEKKCGCLIVVDENKILQGIFTDGDLRRAIQEMGSETLHKKISQLMTKKPRIVAPDALISHAIATMEGAPSPVMILPVVGNNLEVLGIIRMHDIVQSGLK